MYIYDRKPSGSLSRSMEQPGTSRPALRNPYYRDRVAGDFLGRAGADRGYGWAHEGLGQSTADALSKKLKHLSFLPHFVQRNGKDVWLTPSVMDPGIYDGKDKFKITQKLQGCLNGVMQKKEFRHIKVALVDLTKGFNQPEFAGFNHKTPVSAASVLKIAPMLAAYQLRRDLRAMLKQRGTKVLTELFDLVRTDWVGTQRDPGGNATLFSPGVLLRGKLVFVNSVPVSLAEPKAPRLEGVFAGAKGAPLSIKFKSTGEDKARLETLIDEFNLEKEIDILERAKKELAKAKDESMRKAAQQKLAEAKTKLAEAKKTKRPEARKKLEGLGFLERMQVMVGGLVPASNFATSTIVRDIGFLYIASTLLQSGLCDTNRNGGLWLGGDFQNILWRRGLNAKEFFATATAGSLAAFMALLVQDKLVSPSGSSSMRRLMQIEPSNPRHPTTQSRFEKGLAPLGSQRPKKVLAKIGLEIGVKDTFLHECAYIERDVDCGKDKKWTLPLRYVAVGLGAKSVAEFKKLIRELDQCIRMNNHTTPCVKASNKK